jgi:AmmeMemoRadiSam system protein B
MERIRRRKLPAGWYPAEAGGIKKAISIWSKGDDGGSENKAIAGVVPHAGWDFSGELAYDVLRQLNPGVETIAVVGGHLPNRSMVLMAEEDSFETPMGPLEADTELKTRLAGRLSVLADSQPDNTVEIQLPIIKYLYPEAKLLYLRVSPTHDAVILGETLYDLAASTNRSVAVIGSTDLTHYGPAYGFTPAGSGDKAVEWVKNKNDRVFLDFLLRMEAEEAMAHARTNSSACSAGGAAAAVSFSRKMGVEAGSLVGYRMSCDLHASESFVGYGGVAYFASE